MDQIIICIGDIEISSPIWSAVIVKPKSKSQI